MFGNLVSSVQGASGVYQQPPVEEKSVWDVMLDEALGKWEEEEKANPTVSTQDLSPSALNEIVEEALKEQEAELRADTSSISDLPRAPEAQPSLIEQMSSPHFEVMLDIFAAYQKNPKDVREESIATMGFLSLIRGDAAMLNGLEIQLDEQEKMINHPHFWVEIAVSLFDALNNNPEIASWFVKLPAHEALYITQTPELFLKKLQAELPENLEKFKVDRVAYLREYLLEMPIGEGVRASPVDNEQQIQLLVEQLLNVFDVRCEHKEHELNPENYWTGVLSNIELYQHDPQALRNICKMSLFLGETKIIKIQVEQLLSRLELPSEELTKMQEIEGFSGELIVSFYHALTKSEERLSLSKRLLNEMTFSLEWIGDFLDQLEANDSESYKEFMMDQINYLREFMHQAKSEC